MNINKNKLILGLLMLMGMGQVICKNDNQNLIKAIYDRDHTEIKKLVALGVDVNKLDQDRHTALFHAAESQNLESVKILVEQGHAKIDSFLASKLFNLYITYWTQGVSFYVLGYDNIFVPILEKHTDNFFSTATHTIVDGKNSLLQYADQTFEIINFLMESSISSVKYDQDFIDILSELKKNLIDNITTMKNDNKAYDNMIQGALAEPISEDEFTGTSQGVRSKLDLIKEMERVVKQLEQINSLLKA